MTFPTSLGSAHVIYVNLQTKSGEKWILLLEKVICTNNHDRGIALTTRNYTYICIYEVKSMVPM